MFGTGQRLTKKHADHMTALHRAAVVLIALLALTSYGILDRSLEAQHRWSVTTALIGRQQILLQRISGLTAQHTFGLSGTGEELRATIEAFARSEALLTVGDPRERVRVNADPELHEIYFAGAVPLATVVHTFVADARRLSTLSRSDPLFAQAAERVSLAAREQLPARLDAVISAGETQLERHAALFRLLGIVTALALIGTLMGYSLGLVRPLALRAARVTSDREELARVATTDPLTGMLNTRSFHERGAVEIQKAKRYKRPLALLIIDPDELEAINALHGAGAADTMLKALTATLVGGTRLTDLVGRIGAEDLAILLPETGLAGAELLAERLRGQIEALCVPIQGAVVSSTVSIGVAAAEPDATFFGPTFARAGQALYEAKIRGRNRVFSNAAARM